MAGGARAAQDDQTREEGIGTRVRRVPAIAGEVVASALATEDEPLNRSAAQ